MISCSLSYAIIGASDVDSVLQVLFIIFSSYSQCVYRISPSMDFQN